MGQGNVQVLFVESLMEIAEHDMDDLSDLVLREGVGDDDIVDPIQELRVEGPLYLCLDLRLHHLIHPLGRASVESADPALTDIPGPKLRGHDDDRILEVDHSTLVIGQVPLIESMQQETSGSCIW